MIAVKFTDKQLNIVLDACAMFADEDCTSGEEAELISGAMAKLRNARQRQRAAAHAEEG